MVVIRSLWRHGKISPRFVVGMAPFGSLLMGWTADQFGAPLVVAVRGAFCAIAGIIFAWHLPRLRRAAQPILAARGIVLESNVSE
jgi:hypothetical protein